MADKKILVQARIDEELKEEFFKACEKKFLSPSKLIRGWIENFVKEVKEEEN